jgi:TetR/AcrR family transcriptional repressor of mexCD-oprJ operon
MHVEKQAVLDIATRLLAANPRASTQEIAAAAGISRTTLHRMFPSRDALIADLGLMAIERIGAAFASARLEEGTAVDALGRLVEAVVPAVHQFAFLVGEAQLMENEELMTGDLELQRDLEQLLRRGQEEGAIRYDLPVAWLAHSLAGLLLAADEASRLGSIAPRETTTLILEMFLGGAAAKHPRSSLQ